jgi:hypothetical protein
MREAKMNTILPWILAIFGWTLGKVVDLAQK